MEAASQVCNRQPLSPSAPHPITAADTILLTEVHLPLIQLPIDTRTESRPRRVRVENDALADGHRLLLAAIVETRTENQFADPVADRRFVYEPELAATLLDYAAACVSVIELLTIERP